MRTEADLRAALATREDLAPDPHLLLPGVRQLVMRRRRRRSAGAVVAATAAVAVVAALPVVVRGSSAGPGGQSAPSESPPVSVTPALGAPRPPFSFTIRQSAVAGFLIHPIAVNADLQIAHILQADQPQHRASLYVYRPGTNVRAGWDVSLEPVPVLVNGAPAWYSASDGRSAIRWEYAPGGWAVILTEAGPAIGRQTLVSLAEGVRYAAPYQAKVPYRLGYLPAGLAPFHVVQDTHDPAQPRSAVQFETAETAPHPRILDITIIDGSPSARPGWRPNTTVAGRPTQCTDLIDGRRCSVDFSDLTVDVGSGTLEHTELDRMVTTMTFATWHDPATWYDVSAAIPGP